MSRKVDPLQLHPACPEKGFILLEVLVAMGLIVGVWISTTHIYQGLALRQFKLQAQKAQIRKQSDAFELSEHLRSHSEGRPKNESSRVPYRARTLRDAAQSPAKGQR
jgi:Tfp pilus assembly protein PilV